MGDAFETLSARGPAHALEVALDAGTLMRALLSLEPARGLCLLDSCRADEHSGARFLIAGFDPFERIEARGRELLTRTRDGVELTETGSVLNLLDTRLEQLRSTKPADCNHLPALGACLATLSYDLARTFQSPRAFAHPPKERDGPDAVLSFFDSLVIHDYARGTTTVTSAQGSHEKLRAMRDALERVAAALPSDEDDGHRSVHKDVSHDFASSNFTREEYLAAVARVREHIYAGDIYQANLTHQLSCPADEGVRAEEIFLRLRRDHPAPFAAFVRQGGGRTIVSASPERFLRVEVLKGDDGAERGRRVEAWPIKGTRPRGMTEEDDARLRAELLSSEKDRAENVMIVDLLRNDLGRVCRFGTVEVEELCAVEEHPTLFHLVSKVRGLLRDGVTAGEILRATFPCGSITGAPKIRAMRIIDEIERAARGVSMGAIGYFSFDGAIDLNVAIRTITFDAEGRARFNVGGGIVADSDPLAEYEETFVKARALLRALAAGR